MYLQAKKEGLRSRAAIKLRELDAKFHVFRRGQRVLDLGSWPGGWLQIAAQRVGPRGRVVGIDLQPVEALPAGNVQIFTGDAGDPLMQEKLREALGEAPDLLLSDMAPKLSGVKAADRARHMALAELAVGVSREFLAPQGKLVLKLFSAIESEMTFELKKTFKDVAKYRPQSTRKGSSEIYAIAGRCRD